MRARRLPCAAPVRMEDRDDEPHARSHETQAGTRGEDLCSIRRDEPDDAQPRNPAWCLERSGRLAHPPSDRAPL